MLQWQWPQVVKFLGCANIFRYSLEHHNSLPEMIGWGVYGFFLLLLAYFLFEFLTPKFNIDEEIEKDNRSVGFISIIYFRGIFLCHWSKYFIGADILWKN